jgi:hypothetical protein
LGKTAKVDKAGDENALRLVLEKRSDRIIFAAREIEGVVLGCPW